MAIIAPTLPATGQPNSTEDPKILSALTTIRDAINGGLDADNATAAFAALLGVSQASVIRRGKSIIGTTETRTNTAYGLMTTPDRVSSVVLPTDGLIMVGYQATWQESVANAGAAAIFVGANQLKLASGAAVTPQVQLATIGAAGVDAPLNSSPNGLGSYSSGVGYSGDVLTGQAVGAFSAGVCVIFAAAGTYDISVQFKSSSGTVTVKNRKLWVKAEGF